MLEFSDLRTKSGESFTRTVAAKSTHTNSEAGLTVYFVHWYIEAVELSLHAHCREFRDDVLSSVCFFLCTAHAAFPFRMAELHEVLSESECLVLIKFYEVVLILLFET